MYAVQIVFIKNKILYDNYGDRQINYLNNDNIDHIDKKIAASKR